MNHFARRVFVTAHVFATAFAIVLALEFGTGIAAADPDADYAAMLARVKSSTDGIDFRALRDTYAASTRYDPYGGDERELEGAMVRAFNAKDCGEATKQAGALTERNYLNIQAHMVLDMCLTRNNSPRASHHKAMVGGLLRSINQSGDGKTPRTAWQVISVGEEYALLSVLGLNKDKQSLVRADGHVYDRLDTRDKTGAVETRYFNIDRLFARGTKQR